jgi:peptidoglycan/xylan/chitin deacetylase (PgdA/CDA1 family)
VPLVVVLCYHGISASWPSPTAIPADSLEAQLSRFLAEGYRAVTFTQAVLDPPHERTLAVTFDDAYGTTLERAVPVLERLGLPGTLFVPTDRVGRGELLAWPTLDEWIGTEHEPELEPMTWEQIGALADGGWEIGAHTLTHPHLPELDDETALLELSGSKAECEARLGRPCRSVAYPYGEVDERIAGLAGDAGFVAGAGLAIADRPSPLAWPRVCVSSRDTAERLWLRSEPIETDAPLGAR